MVPFTLATMLAAVGGSAIGYLLVYFIHRRYAEREEAETAKLPHRAHGLGRCSICGQYIEIGDPDAMAYHAEPEHNARPLN